ncbi:hypothetical protein [Amphritea sp.]|uniref:hypothetical protein n=1 Tax=Amphritea sp. TaxID=1872502 RepID=UPI003A911847
MNQNELRRALRLSAKGIEEYILSVERSLPFDRRESLISYLSSINFSSMKYEILTAHNEYIVKALLIGLLFGQIDAYVSQERSIMDGYMKIFGQACQHLGLSEDFIQPITRHVDEICDFF